MATDLKHQQQSKRTYPYIEWVEEESGRFRTFFFEVVTNETIELRSDLTEHPVEAGFPVTDGIRHHANLVRFEGFVSQTPVNDLNEHRGAWEKLDLHLQTKAESAVTLQFPRFDPVAEAIETLNHLRRTGTLVTVVTREREFESMVLTDILPKRAVNEGQSSSIDLTFKQIRTVETKLVSAPVPKEVRAKQAVNLGAQDPVPARDQEAKKTALASIWDRFFRNR